MNQRLQSGNRLVSEKHTISALLANGMSAVNSQQILPLLDELGVRVLSTLTGDSRFAEVQTLHRAEANLLVCSKAFLNVARGLQEKYGTPYTESSFYGMNNTSAALKLAAMLDDADLTARVQALISRRDRINRTFSTLQTISGRKTGTDFQWWL